MPEQTAHFRTSSRQPAGPPARVELFAKRSSSGPDQRADLTLEISQRRRRQAATDDRTVARLRNHRRRHHPIAFRCLRNAIDTLAQPKHVRDRGSATSEKQNHALADRELRRANDDAAKASEGT